MSELKWGVEMPVGTVRIRARRQNGRKRRIRYIKVRADGPPKSRWVSFAQWWWTQHRGPIPAGKVVAHIDGDTLNDAPKNLGLLTHGDVLFLCHRRDPELTARNRQACLAAAGRSNRERAELRRRFEILPSKWYAVDLAAKIIVNRPTRKRYECVGDRPRLNGEGHEAAMYGWPDVGGLAAAILAALAELGRPARWTEIRDAVLTLRRRSGVSRTWPRDPQNFYVESLKLRRLGWVESARTEGPSSPKTYWITAAGLAARQEPWRYVAVRGRDLLGLPEFEGFRLVRPAKEAIAS